MKSDLQHIEVSRQNSFYCLELDRLKELLSRKDEHWFQQYLANQLQVFMGRSMLR